MKKSEIFAEIKNRIEEVLSSGDQAYIEDNFPELVDFFVAATVVFEKPPLPTKTSGGEECKKIPESELDPDIRYFLRLLDLTIAYHLEEESTAGQTRPYIGPERRELFRELRKWRRTEENKGRPKLDS